MLGAELLLQLGPWCAGTNDLRCLELLWRGPAGAQCPRGHRAHVDIAAPAKSGDEMSAQKTRQSRQVFARNRRRPEQLRWIDNVCTGDASVSIGRPGVPFGLTDGGLQVPHGKAMVG